MSVAPAAASDAVQARSAKVSTGPAGSGPGRGGASAGSGPKAGFEKSSGSRAAQAARPARSSRIVETWWVSSVSGASGPLPMPWTRVLATARLTSVTGLGNRASIAPRTFGTPLITATVEAATVRTPPVSGARNRSGKATARLTASAPSFAASRRRGSTSAGWVSISLGNGRSSYPQAASAASTAATSSATVRPPGS